MENLCGFNYSEQSSMAPPSLPETSHNLISSDLQLVQSCSSSSDEVLWSKAVGEEDVSLRAKVASHPLFPQLLHAYIDCQKLGSPPPEMAQLLDEIRGENNGLCQISSFYGVDPELDNFMETYCNLLVKYKSDISRPFDEATTFLNDMETQLNSIRNGLPNISVLTVTEASEKGPSIVENEAIDNNRINEERELKDNLLHRYSGYISSLKHELSKTKKKQRLPEEAKQILLAWWNVHFEWPYPTDADKVTLAEWTGLDQKQVNNWFINQRKRRWKKTEEMQTVLKGLYGPFCMSDSD